MAKAAKKSEEEQMLEDKAEIEQEMKDAATNARLIFGLADTEKPTLTMIYGILERLDGYDDDDDAKAIVCEQLSMSVEALKETFGEAPVEFVFRHYDRFYEEDAD